VDCKGLDGWGTTVVELPEEPRPPPPPPPPAPPLVPVVPNEAIPCPAAPAAPVMVPIPLEPELVLAPMPELPMLELMACACARCTLPRNAAQARTPRTNHRFRMAHFLLIDRKRLSKLNRPRRLNSLEFLSTIFIIRGGPAECKDKVALLA